MVHTLSIMSPTSSTTVPQASKPAWMPFGHGLDALVASVHRRCGRPRGWWTIGQVVEATTVFEAVHVDHPDEHRCYWVLPNLLPQQRCGKCLHPLHRAARQLATACSADAGVWLLVARHCPPLSHGGDGGAALADVRRKFTYTVAFLRGSQCAWVRPSALVSIAPTLPGHSTGALRPPPAALGPAVFVL